MTKGEEIYQDILGYIGKGDIDGLMRDLYHDDAEMVTFEFILKGKNAIKKYLEVDEPRITGKVLGMTTDYFTASDDVIMFKASVKTEKFGTIKADDALFLKEGKVFRHIALTIPPDATKEWAMKEVE
jgi:hypothetical protein